MDFLSRNYGVQEVVAQNFSSAERKEFFNPESYIQRKYTLEIKGKSSHSWVKENQENCHHQPQSKGIALKKSS